MTFLLTIAEADEKMIEAGYRFAQPRESYRAMLSARPSICSEYWKAMREVVEAGERLVGCEIVSISWANAYDAFKAAQARLRSLEDGVGKDLGKEGSS